MFDIHPESVAGIFRDNASCIGNRIRELEFGGETLSEAKIDKIFGR